MSFALQPSTFSPSADILPPIGEVKSVPVTALSKKIEAIMALDMCLPPPALGYLYAKKTLVAQSRSFYLPAKDLGPQVELKQSAQNSFDAVSFLKRIPSDTPGMRMYEFR